MADPTLPAPLVPAEVDLRGLNWMELDVVRLMDSDMFALSTGDEFKAAVALWCKSFHQKPGGSLPDNDKVLAELSRAKSWKKVRAVALRGWIKCSDGRLYHHVIAEKVLTAWPIRQAFDDRKTSEADRKARERADRKALFELLRSHSIVPDYDTKTRELRELAKPFVSHPPSPEVTDPSRDMSRPVTAKTGPDLTGPDLTEEVRGTAPAQAPAPPEPDLAGHQPTAYGAITRQLKVAGISRVNPGELRFRALVDAGATAEEFLAYAESAQKADNPWAYLVATVEGERKRAAQIAEQLHRGPMPSNAPPPTVPSAAAAETARYLAEQQSHQRTAPPAELLARVGKAVKVTP